MTDREFFIKTIDDELPRFNRVFKAFSATASDYKPDPKSKTALELAIYMAAECQGFEEFLKKGKLDVMQSSRPELSTFEAAAENLERLLSGTKLISAQMSEEDWQSPAQMLAGDKVEWETTKGQMAWGLLLDLIHHRGQLSTYIRPMGGKVPSIYGPSADSNS